MSSDLEADAGATESPWSLSRLLFVSHTILAGVTLLGFAAVMLVMAYQSMIRQAESELLGAAESLIQDLSNGLSPFDLEIPETFIHRFGKAPRDHAYWILWDRDQNIVRKKGEVSEATTPIGKSAHRGGPHPYVTRSSGRRLELLLNTTDGGQLLIGRPLAKEFDGLVRLLARLVGICVIGLIIAGCVASWIAKRIAGPINSFAKMTSGISHRNLDTTINLSHSTTEMKLLSRSFNRMLGELKSAFDRQRQFTSDAAHELRTPVAIILSQSEFSLSKDRTSDDYRQGLETCLNTAKHMKTLVDNLLVLSRSDLEQQPLKVERINLAALVGEWVDSVKPLAQQRNMTITTNLFESFVDGDPTSLRQVVLNLLSNAIQYNEDSGQISVEVCTVGDGVRLSVKDTGIGIAANDLPRIWDRFYRVDQARTHGDGQGTGLGLSLVTNWVQSHGGTVAIESELSVGTTVIVTLPSAARRDK